MAIIQCKKCGHSISDRAERCIYCGCHISENKAPTPKKALTERQEPSPAAVPTKKHKPTHKKKTRVSKKLIGIFVAVAIVIFFAILIFTHTICLNHSYSEANVLEPQTCYHCGKTKGEPKPLMEIEFPTNGIGSLLPLPESNMGEILWDDSNSFNAYIGNTTQADFNEYVKKCSDVGFDIDYQKGNNFYYSEDSSGNNLDIWYYEKDIMQIQIYSEDVFEDASTNESKNDNDTICPIEIVAQKATGTEYGYSHAEFTVKNVSGQNINTLTLDIKILDKNQTVLSTTHPQEGVLLADGESIVIEALTEEGAYAMQLDGYSYSVGTDWDGEYVQGYFSDTELVILCDDADEESNTNSVEGGNSHSGNNDLEETFISNGCFAYTPRSFMERFDKADKELDGYNYTYMRANGEENLYYELADIEGGYEYVESVGMVAFDDSTGSSLSIDDDFTENIISTITILAEDIDDVPALLVCSMCAADPSLDFMAAYNIGDNVIENAETADGYTYNGVNYVITENDEYYFIIISVDTSENTSADKKRTSVETTEYELNFADFCVPNTFEHTETDGNVMWFQKGENNRMMVKIEKIPDYMKIDTGSGSAITSTKDVVDFYTYDYEDDTISEGWVKLGKQDCYEKVFSVDTDTGVRKGRSIVIPINGNEGAISVLALCEDDELLSAVDIIIESVSY